MDGPEEELADVERRAVAQLSVEGHGALDHAFHDARLLSQLLRDAAVEELPERGDPDEGVDAPRLERLREPIGGQLVEVGDLGADQQRDEEATRKLERVAER